MPSDHAVARVVGPVHATVVPLATGAGLALGAGVLSPHPPHGVGGDEGKGTGLLRTGAAGDCTLGGDISPGEIRIRGKE